MPLPILHTTAGFIIYRSLKAKSTSSSWRTLLVLVLLSNLPDLDFLPGLMLGDAGVYHRQASHSLIASLSLSLALSIPVSRFLNIAVIKAFLVCFAAYLAHLIMDMLSGPEGIQLFWPISRESIGISLSLFPGGGRFGDATSLSEFIKEFFSSPAASRIAQELTIALSLCLGVSFYERCRFQIKLRSLKWRYEAMAIVPLVSAILFSAFLKQYFS